MTSYVKGASEADVVSLEGQCKQETYYSLGGKRLVDILFVAVSAPISLFFIAIMALLVMRDGGNPFFIQERVGRDGKTFRMFKIRTMVLNADKRLAAYLAENPKARIEWERDQKLKNDPRITRIGKLLRRTSMDELPQLWNVLRGDMSIVGPRPMMTEQKAIYPGQAYFKLRPGITGPWQVSDRNMISFAARAEYDTRYLAELSPGKDLSILMRTTSVVLRCTGY
ncbi:sugar transferase [Ruegeria sp. AU67]|uniref:sugar transferase n=1 Tax=Ruegeria sp. AU67 TaxID=2108530 RepID=UPI000D69EDD9|nr:sugar transferase [Ruegeria sp. AU67]